ncbi:hypothetical protein T552_02301 [Pneumocystis carinii B80]|uniref:Poly A polymerase head domain-containing protein n=1 Tax=Pneumocystis carinii (strain B80) TaxID=1408658 RepID=A0A0W4ZG22_PNEC8|nr:hypothetical protein T552_02301 [Pneumocystis carinii B80]KTW27317.1 hypothetical protein T552_02301 [Pneumocystis carinii B80]
MTTNKLIGGILRKNRRFEGLNSINKRFLEEINWYFPRVQGLMKKSGFFREILGEIMLNEREKEVKKVILLVCEECRRRGRPIIARFAGGWVRDKLLGLESNDLDVVIDKMSGYEFAVRLKRYIFKKGMSEIGYSQIAKIERNPEKSKHLETATTNMMGIEIDFVNLRSESYSEDSRIPMMEFGTPEEDAMRRDCTINALFYNLHTNEIEDFTKRGLEDMKKKRIATPLEPYQTFDDDPLRILRFIRFSSRFGFEIDLETKEAIMHPKIKKSLSTKISKERIGVEIKKMLEGINPYGSLELIYELGLYENIFSMNSSVKPQKELSCIPLIIELTEWILQDKQEDRLKEELESTESSIHPISLILNEISINPFEEYMDLLGGVKNNMIPWLLSILIPWKEQVIENKKGNIQCSSIVVKEGLKMSNNIASIVDDSFCYFQEAQKISMECMNGIETRVSLGCFVRLVKKNWPFAVFLGLIDEMLTSFLPQMDKLDDKYEIKGSKLEIEPLIYEKRAILSRYKYLLDQIHHENLQKAYSMQPLVNGHILSKTFGFKGPQIGIVLEQVILWQLKNPQGTPEQCLSQLNLKHI